MLGPRAIQHCKRVLLAFSLDLLLLHFIHRRDHPGTNLIVDRVKAQDKERDQPANDDEPAQHTGDGTQAQVNVSIKRDMPGMICADGSRGVVE